MAQPKIYSYKGAQVARMYLNLFLDENFTGVQVADFGLTKEFSQRGVKQMRAERKFFNSMTTTIWVSGFDELGNQCVLTSDLLYYQLGA